MSFYSETTTKTTTQHHQAERNRNRIGNTIRVKLWSVWPVLGCCLQGFRSQRQILKVANIKMRTLKEKWCKQQWKMRQSRQLLSGAGGGVHSWAREEEPNLNVVQRTNLQTILWSQTQDTQQGPQVNTTANCDHLLYCISLWAVSAATRILCTEEIEPITKKLTADSVKVNGIFWWTFISSNSNPNIQHFDITWNNYWLLCCEETKPAGENV